MDIQPGKSVTVTVTRTIISEAAQKTLARIFMKDESIAKSRNTEPKKVRLIPRAGRLWAHRPRGTSNRVPTVGDSATLSPTIDVVRDLESVARYIEIK